MTKMVIILLQSIQRDKVCQQRSSYCTQSTGQLAERWVVCNMSSQGLKVSMETTLGGGGGGVVKVTSTSKKQLLRYRGTSHIRERGAYLGLSHYIHVYTS